MSVSESDSEFESADEGVEVEEHVCDEDGDHLASVINSETAEQRESQLLSHAQQHTSNEATQINEIESSEDVVKEDDGWGWEVDEDVLNAQTTAGNADSYIKPAAESSPSSPELTKNIFDKLTASNDSAQIEKASWGWSSWGSSLLSSATSSVATFTSQVGQGLSTVLDSSLGAPAPEELAEQEKHSQRLEDESLTIESQSSSISLGSLVSGVSSLTLAIEQTSSKVVSGSLNTLELLGKKTMDILQEGDPGLKNKRAFITGKGPSLSDVLKEAKQKSEQSQSDVQEECHEKSVYFSAVFDDCQGLAHLEALEMLSSQCENKVQMALVSGNGEEIEEMQAAIYEIRNAVNFELSDDEDVQQTEHDFTSSIQHHMQRLHVNVQTDKLLKLEEASRNWVEKRREQPEDNVKEIHDTAIRYLAEFCAAMIEVIHKVCELILLEEDRDAKQDATYFTNIVSVACVDVQVQASQYTSLLNHCNEDLEAVSTLVTNIFLEATNCSTCLQDALRLVVPILQFQFVTKSSR